MFSGAYRLVCYYTGAASFRHSLGKCEPEQIDGSLCTHIVYAYANAEELTLTKPTKQEIDM
jgi:GH18 family chitinase